MKKLLLCLLAVAAYGTDCVISDTVRTPFGGYFSGKISVALNSPAASQPLYSGSQTLTGWQTTIDVPVSANGAVAVTLVCTDSITPSGTSYAARYQPTSGSGWAEVWNPATGTTTIRAMRATTVPTPTVTFQPGQIAPGTNGQVLTTTGGATAWGTPGGVTSITGTANQITASASTVAVTLSLPATITGLTSVASTNFVGTATAASALASTVASGRVWIGNGTGAPTSSATICADTANTRVGVGTCSPQQPLHVSGAMLLTGDITSGSSASGHGFYGGDAFNAGAGVSVFGSTHASAASQVIFTRGAFAETARFTANGNLLIGGTTDGNYRLDIQTKGSTGVARFFDQTATTGSTLVVVQAGQGQSGNLMEWRNYSGSAIARVASDGGLAASYFEVGGGFGVISTNQQFPNNFTLNWSSSAIYAGTKDSGLKRAAAANVAVTDGASGLGKIVVSQSTPAASSDACTAGALWADATYIYACTASGTIKRATLASF